MAPNARDYMLRTLRDRTLTYGKADVIAVALLAAVVSVWAAVADGSFSPGVFLACQAAFFAFYLVGTLAASWTALARGVLFDLPLRLLLGYGVVNTLLLGLAWLSPLGIGANFAIVVAIALAALFAARERRSHQEGFAGLWALGLGLVATTLWCRDSIDPVVEGEGAVVFKPWVDGFYHAVHVRIFAESHGASTIEDFRLAGVPARLYHYGVYLFPALIKSLSGLHSYAAFAGVLAPVGVLFTGLAAYAFFGSLWGSWAGVAACAALLTLPDGAQQGFQNPFMSYQWLTQISPSATYGLALLAVAWLFVVRSCKDGNRAQLGAGWFIAGVVAMYKLHYVIASALLLLLVPALFFRASATWRKRAFWVALAGAFYALALVLGQKVPGVPLIRLDGSSLDEILHLVHTFHVPGALREYLDARTGRGVPWTSNLAFGVPYVLLAAFGVLLPLLLGLVVALRKRMTLLELCFPLLLLLNFLVMFFGLALDFERSTPDELSHRPVMLVYFFVTGWVGAALGLLVTKSRRFARFAAPVIIGVTALLFTVPASLGSGVQLMWAMPKISPVRLPTPVVRAAEHIRQHGDTKDIFQDSQFDRIYAIAALAERRPFVAHTMTLMPFRADMIATRSAAVDRMMGMRQATLVTATARAFGIRWFIVHRGNKVAWPSELADEPVLESGPVRLYEF